MGKIIRAVWLCTYSNEEKRSHLQLWRRKPGEYGQWIPNLLSAFETEQTIELHVVSSENMMIRSSEAWTNKNIFYHCYKSGIPVLGRSWPAVMPVDHITGFWLNRRRISKIVEQLKPDIIHLFGVENPQYGAAVLDLLEKYPVLVTIQGFIHRELQYHNTLYTRVRCRYEKSLLSACHYFSGDYESESVVRHFNSDVSYRHVYFPVNEALISCIPPEGEKSYDLLFVGGLTKQKGFNDFLEIVRSMAERNPNILAAVVGNPGDCPQALDLIYGNKMGSSICWLGKFPSQEGLFRVYRQSKLFLAPTYNDCFPSTIRESMMLGTPVIAYATGGIPWANQDGNINILVVPQGDVIGMADAALHLLRDAQTRAEMATCAQAFAVREFSLKTNADKIKNAYQEIVRSR